MKIKLDTDELYPVYTLCDAGERWYEHEITVTEETYLRWKDAMDEFWKVQKEMEFAVANGEDDDR